MITPYICQSALFFSAYYAFLSNFQYRLQQFAAHSMQKTFSSTQHAANHQHAANFQHLFPQVVLKKMFIHRITAINSFVNMMNLNIFIILIGIRQVICLKQWLRQTIDHSLHTSLTCRLPTKVRPRNFSLSTFFVN